MTDESQQLKPPGGAAATPAERVDRRLLELLVCPRTKTSLIYDAAAQELISKAAGLAYPIREGIPVMLEEEARALTDDELNALGKR
ncbi:MAG TPA: Trm112 family protein [Hyphomicrobiaceae bacterium]|nr:Trm112 family protein [Hyphomicrobiaceae bacterium]